MRRTTVIFAVLALLAVVIVPLSQNRSEPKPQAGAFELKQKQALIEQDKSRTHDINLIQLSKQLSKSLKQLDVHQSDSQQTQQHKLAEIQKKQNNLFSLIWSKPSGKTNNSNHSDIQVGVVPAHFNQYTQEAKQLAQQNKTYYSPIIRHQKNDYFVVGVANKEKNSTLVGIFNASILEQISTQQKRNLRLVPYPGEHRVKLQSIDADSGRDVKVRNGEDNAGVSHYHKYQVAVKFQGIPNDQDLERMRQDLQGAMYKKLGDTFVFESKQVTAEQMMEYFRKQQKIVYVEPHFYYNTNTSMNPNGKQSRTFNDEDAAKQNIPNDELYSLYQWNLPLIQTESGWNISKGSDQITVAVIDTGVELNHPDLRNNLVKGINVIDESQSANDDVGHGTHVAGIIAATVNNGEGVAGMSWYNRIMPVKVLDSTGSGSTYAVAQGIIWATDQGAKVINMSLGNYANAEFLHDAIRYAYERDVLLIAATGNDNTSSPGYPAAYPEVFAVSAIDENSKRADFSNYGDYVDVVAPGVSIASTYTASQYAALSGTSMASPHVAALAALIRSANPDLTNKQVMDIMRSTANDLGTPGKDPYFGYGQINVSNALAKALHPESFSDQSAKAQNNSFGSRINKWFRSIFQF